MAGTTIFSDLLRLLEVAHTPDYSDAQFRQMPFKTLFGFTRLLKSYGIGSIGETVADKDQLTRIPTPFLAQSGSGFVIVTGFSDGGEKVDYLYYHRPYTVSTDEFKKRWSGTVLLIYPDEGSKEPDYAIHRRFQLAGIAKNWILAICVLFLLTAGVIYSGIYAHLSTIFLFVLTLAGVAVSFMLIQKSAKVKNHAADKVCGIIQKHGCDTVLEQKASTFFGLFSWSEVGMAYFGITMLTMLVFPQEIHNLALVNACCCPFSFWSVWYQKYRIKAWCTLCLTVQAILWLQLACYILGGWWHGILPLRVDLFLLGAAYVATLLGLNRLMTAFEKSHPQN